MNQNQKAMKKLLSIFLLIPVLSFAAVDNMEKKTKEEKHTIAASTILQGTVGDVRNYEPLKDVMLTITSADASIKKVVKTDDKGKFVVNDIPAGIYKVKFEKKGYETGTYQSLTVKEDGSNNFGFTLFEK